MTPLAKLIARLTKGYIKETGRAPTGLDKLRIKMEAAEQLRQMNKVIRFPQQRSFKQEIEAMIDDGTIKMGQVDKMNDNVRTRQMFQKSNLNKTEDQIKAEIEANNKKGIESMREKLMDPEDMAQGGRAGFVGGGMGRRGFLKLLGMTGAGIAGVKSGIVNILGKGAGKEVAKEVVQQSTTTPPPYFFNLVNKIRTLGDETLATTDKAVAKKYKDYVMEEDFAGNIEIIKKGEDIAGNKTQDVYMSYKVDEIPLKKGGSRKVEDYEEFTARPDMEGKMKDVEQGVPDSVVEEAMGQAPSIKKASGGIARMLGE